MTIGRVTSEFIHQHQRLRVRHTCDNQGFVDQLRWMYKQERYHTIPDMADNDLIVQTAHWAKKNNSRLIWQQGHIERRETDPTKWTNNEWANGEANRLAGQAWGEECSHVQNQTNAIRFWHAGNIQVITSTGSIAGRILKRLPEIITAERGMTALQKATQMTDEAITLLDDEATLRGAKHFRATMYSVLHWAKFYTHHWYTASRAYKSAK